VFVPVLMVSLFPALYYMSGVLPVLMSAGPMVLLAIYLTVVVLRKRMVLPRRKQNYALLITWMEQRTEGRDMSHGMAHFYRVLAITEAIASKMVTALKHLHSAVFDPLKVVRLAALVHDIIDHKYVRANALKQAKQELKEALQTFCSCTRDEINAIMLIITNMSFSQEKRGALTNLGDLQVLRDIVSDADKIDALGEIGLMRCQEYTRSQHMNITDVELHALVRAHCREKLLLLKDQYIRTSVGKSLARVPHTVIEEYVNNAEKKDSGN